jgi:hypothetical protein
MIFQSRLAKFGLVVFGVSVSLTGCHDTRFTVPFNPQEKSEPAKTLPSLSKHRRLAPGLAAHLFPNASVAADPAPVPTLAPFFGNLTVVAAAPNNGVTLQRQANCSLLYSNFQYSASTTEVTATIDSQTPAYEKILHDNAFLTTTPYLFPNGCVDHTLGVLSGAAVFLGPGKSGQFIAVAQEVGSVYAGTMSGNTMFSTPVQLVTSLPSVSLASADLNKDGNQDVISINTDGINSSLDVFLGNGDGTFQTATTFPITGAVTQFGFINDMNGDGKLDIVVGAGFQSSFQFLIFLGDGTGHFAAAVPYTPNQDSLSFDTTFISADVNGDGHADIITSAGLVFLGQTSGTSFTLAAPSFPAIGTESNDLGPGLVAADFNNDGKLDLATDDGATIRTYLGNGDGTFSAGSAYATLPNRGLIIGTDLDGDGNVDLISGFGGNGLYGGDDYVPNQTYALLGNGTGSFQGAPRLPVSYSGTNVGDLNGDGRPDLVAFSLNSNNQGVLTSYITQSNGIPAAAQQLVLPAGQGAEAPVLGKFMGGATEDVFWVGSTPIGLNFNLSVGNGDGSFQLPVTTNAPSLVPSGLDIQQDIEGVQTVDVNHDGKADLVYWFFDIDGITNTYYEGIAVQLGNGDGTFQAPKITLTYNSTTSIFDSETSSIAALYDVNKDNFPDLFLVVPGATVMGTPQNSLALYISNGDGTFQSPTTLTLTGNILPPSSGYGSPLAFGDLNGDGNVDIVASGSSSDATTPTVAVALGNGNGTFKPATTFILEGFGYDGSPLLADFTADGKLDLVLPGATEGGGGIFPGNGDGTFQSISNGDGTISPTQQIALSVGYFTFAADFNNDGKLDLLFGNVLLLSESSAVPPVLAPTTTVVTSSLNPSTVGATVTFRATVTSTTAGTINGAVNFLDGATTIGSGTLAAGSATFATSTLTRGPHTITATYVGNASYGTSTSTAITQTVNAATKAGTSIVVVSTVNPSVYGNTVGMLATVTSTTPGNFTGSVSYYDGTTLLATEPIQTNGTSNLFTPDYNVGANSVTAVYSGDANYAASTSAAITQTVTIAPTTTMLSGSPTSAASGTSIQFTATTTTSGTFPITGTVNLLDGGAPLLSAPIGAGGVTTFATTTLSVGMHTITAQYVGNANFVGSSSSAVTVNITSVGTFTLSANPAAVTVKALTPGMTTITVTPVGGFNQGVNFSCVNPPAGFSCAFVPATVTPNGAAASTTLTIADALTGDGDRTRRAAIVIGVGTGAGSDSCGSSNGGASSERGSGLAWRSMNRSFAFAFGGELMLLGLLFVRRRKFSARTTSAFLFGATPSATARRAGRLAYTLIALAITATVIAGCAGPGSTQTTTLTINAVSGGQTVTLPLTVTFPK